MDKHYAFVVRKPHEAAKRLNELEVESGKWLRIAQEFERENEKLREALETIRDAGLEPIDQAYRRLASEALLEAEK